MGHQIITQRFVLLCHWMRNAILIWIWWSIWFFWSVNSGFSRLSGFYACFFFLFVIWNKQALNALKFLHFEYDFIRCNNIEFSEQMFSELITSLNSIHGYFLPQIGMRLRFKYIAWTLASNTSVQSLYLPKYQIKCE